MARNENHLQFRLQYSRRREQSGCFLLCFSQHSTNTITNLRQVVYILLHCLKQLRVRNERKMDHVMVRCVRCQVAAVCNNNETMLTNRLNNMGSISNDDMGLATLCHFEQWIHLNCGSCRLKHIVRLHKIHLTTKMSKDS